MIPPVAPSAAGKDDAMRKNAGMMLLAVWLILQALTSLLRLGFPYAGTLLAVVALLAGILILAGK
jgi:hypothetical protein